MSQSAQQDNTSALSKPAQELLEQYKNYREDGIVEIKEPITCDETQPQEHKQNNTKDIKLKQKKKLNKKRSTIINCLNSKQSKQSVGGYNDSWWDDLIKAENKTENDCKHKLNNIKLMQKYETEKDPSPFNEDNHMNVTNHWETYLKQESETIADQYFQKIAETIDEKNTKKKKSKKKVTFAKNLVTKQGSSENIMDDDIKKTGKKLKFPSKKQYGDLVGFFNKKSSNKNKKKSVNVNETNPYLDKELMKGFGDFSPDKNQSFENKFDAKNVSNNSAPKPMIIESNEFKSMIIPSNEFKTDDKIIENNNEKSIKKDLNDNVPAFNGHVFERKPPDMIYINENKSKDKKRYIKVKPQPLPKIGQPKTSLFRKRIELNDEYYKNEIELKDDNNNNNEIKNKKKKVTFSDNLVTKQLVINDDEDNDIKKEDICLLFLDVDGVLNCSYSPSLSRAHILRLKKILNLTKNCKICISSSWRIYKQTRIKLLNGLIKFGNININNIIIGDTPKIQKDAFKYRAEEIKMYLQYDEYLNNNYNVLKWCAIDDIPLDIINKQYTNFMKGHFVKINPNKGLTDYDVEKVVCILTGINQINTKKRLENISENMIKKEENMQLQIIDNNKNKKERIKVLFLDVDGVLNYKDFDDKGVNGALCIKCLRRLKQILDKTECKIVLSTSWRQIPSAKEQLLRQLSSQIGIDVNKYVIGDTPILGTQMKKPIEICQYLENIKNKYDIISWIAIDDMPLNRIGTIKTKEIFKAHFVKTDIQIGLNDKNVLNAISILNAK